MKIDYMDWYDYDDYFFGKAYVPKVPSSTPAHRCPNCHTGLYGYCRECGHAYPLGGTVTHCQHPPEHTENPDRILHCAGCGAEVDREGVIVGGKLIMFDFVKKAYGLE